MWPAAPSRAYASLAQFEAAFCADVRSDSTIPIETSGAELAGLDA
jgi:hypothetical protein